MEKIYSFNISPSGLDTMEKCPMQWAHFNILKTDFIKTESKPLQIGSAHHKLIENFYRGHSAIQFSEDWLFSNWEKYYKFRVKEEFRNKKDFEEGHLALRNLYKIMSHYNWLSQPYSLNGALGLELYFKYPFMGHPKYQVNISGKIDCVVESYGEICLIDWKTGKSKNFIPDTLDECYQIVLYAVALKKLYDINIYEQRLFLVYFYLDKVLEFKIGKDHLEVIKNKVNEFLDIYDSGEYEKRKGTHCKFCPFREVCLIDDQSEVDLLSEDIPF